MATVHFIWWGPYQRYLCVETPKAVADACRDHKIVFWCKSEEMDEFRIYLGASLNIDIKACNSIKSIVGDQLYNQPSGGQLRHFLDDAQDVLEYLASVRAYSAVKDLLSLVILYAHGGYYLDTTTVVPSGADGSLLNKSLKYSGDGPRVPVIGLELNGTYEPSTNSHQWLLQTATSIMKGSDADSNLNPLQVPVIDVWAIYSPQQHESVKLMLYSYVSRCNRMGLYPNGKPSNFARIVGDDVMTRNGRFDDEHRRNLIGALIISSVYDGLLRECNGDGKRMRYSDQSTLYWKGIADPARAPDTVIAVPFLGIEKIHRNSWQSL